MVLFPLDYETQDRSPEYYYHNQPLNMVLKYRNRDEADGLQNFFQTSSFKESFAVRIYPEKQMVLISADFDYWLKLSRLDYQDNKPVISDFIQNASSIVKVMNSPVKSIHLKNKSLSLDNPLIMGILNVTDNSFYDGGRYFNMQQALQHCRDLIAGGADIIDIGGESSRPGSEPVSLDDELKRVIPVIREIRKETNIPLSVDTVKSQVAEQAIQEGADMVNDISALTFDNRMAGVVRDAEVPVILMHMKGNPKTMQENPFYEDVVAELIAFFDERITALVKSGIPQDNIILDPGIGFGKRVEDNIAIIRNMSAFKKYGLPLLMGLSRKMFIGKILETENGSARPAEERLYGTMAGNAFAYIKGASLFRVHDVKEHKDLMKVLRAIK